MSTLIQDPMLSARLIAERKATGHDRHDEVWDGVYVMAPDPGNLHQSTVTNLTTILGILVEFTGKGRVFPGVNVTDREVDWMQNFRCPDVAVYLDGNPAEDRESHWLGGPDFAVEITSSGEEPRQKLDFYSSVNTQELLIIDRNPWQLELYRHNGTALQSAGVASLNNQPTSGGLVSQKTGLTFSLNAGNERPQISVAHADTQQSWTF